MALSKYVTKRVNDVAKAGSILALVSASLGHFFMIACIVIICIDYDKFEFEKYSWFGLTIFIVFLVYFCLSQILSTIYNILFLRKRTDKLRVRAAIFSFIAWNYLAGILLLNGKSKIIEKTIKQDGLETPNMQTLGVN